MNAITGVVYEEGTYARPPCYLVTVDFDDGENVVVSIGGGENFACGLCYQPGEQKAAYGQAALDAAIEFMQYSDEPCVTIAMEAARARRDAWLRTNKR